MNDEKETENWYWDVFMKMSTEEKKEWNENRITDSKSNITEITDEMDELEKLEASLFLEKDIEFAKVVIREGINPAMVKSKIDGMLEWKIAYAEKMEDTGEPMDKQLLLIQDICLDLCTIPGQNNDPWDDPKAWELLHKKYGTFGISEILFDKLLGPAKAKIEEAKKFRMEQTRKGFRSVKSKNRNPPPPFTEDIPTA